ncbi:MAG: helix-turn-helix domain-containing protein [Gammaproteobacteria bacterium]
MTAKSAKTGECSKCGAAAPIVRGAYRDKNFGLRSVVLQGIEMVSCEQCGNVDPILPRLNDLLRTLAVAVLAKPYRLAGEEVRFLRVFLGLTQEEFARLLHVDNTTLSKWETGDDPVGAQSDLLIRTMVLIHGEGLRGKMNEIAGRFAQIRTTRRRVRIEVQASGADFEYRYA